MPTETHMGIKKQVFVSHISEEAETASRLNKPMTT